MKTENYHFKIGEFSCIVVSDGHFVYPHPSFIFFPGIPKEQLIPVLSKHGIGHQDWEEYISPYSALFVDTGEHKVLIDTGAGGMAPTTGKLMSNLEVEGISPEEIEIVIITHVHPDHAGGNLDKEGKVAFPNAQFVLHSKEWEFWRNEPDLSEFKLVDFIPLVVDCANRNLPPIQGQLRLIDQEEEIVPGIQAFFTPGHTPGHLSLTISSDDEKLFYLSDAIIHPVHIEHPDWVSGADLNPEETISSRYKVIDGAIAEQALVFANHFPYPGLGHIVKKEGRGEWQPIEAYVQEN